MSGLGLGLVDPTRYVAAPRCCHCRAVAVDAERELCPSHLVRWHVDSGDVAGAYAAAAEHGVSATTVRRLIKLEADRQHRDDQRRAAEARAYLAACMQHGADVLARLTPPRVPAEARDTIPARPAALRGAA